MILKLIQRFSRKQKPTELGRWSLLNSSDALQRELMANIDHCGPCGFEQISHERIKILYINWTF